MKINEMYLKGYGNEELDSVPLISSTIDWLHDTLDTSLSFRPAFHVTGSVANRTNISTSDLDVRLSIPALADGRQSQFDRWSDLREEVFCTLTQCVGERCTLENKCLRVAGDASGGTAIDVLPCLDAHDDEILFWAKDAHGALHEVRSHPRLHQANTELRDRRTGGAYRQAVRAIKWGKSALVEAGVIRSEDAPSYFLECLTYSLPDEMLATHQSLGVTCGLLEELMAAGHQTTPSTVSGRDVIFGPKLWHWNVNDKDAFVRHLTDAVNASPLR